MRFDSLYMQSVIWVLWKYSKGFKCGIGSSAQPRCLSWRRGRTLSCASMSSYPLWSSNLYDFPATICQRLEGHSCSLSLCWFVCKGGIRQFVSQDQMRSWGWNMLALSILWSPRVCQCDLGSGLQHLGLCYRYPLLWETSQMGLKASLATISLLLGLPWWLSWWRICLQCRRSGFNPWVGKVPWRREQLPTLVFWPGEFHGLFHGVTKSRTWLSSFHFTSLLLVTSEAETCVMGFLNTMTSGAVLDQHLLSYK